MATPAVSLSEPSVVPGDYVMTASDFRRLTTMLHSDAGIVMNESKATLVYSRLAKRLRALGLESFRSYCALVSSADGLDERQKMISALTTNLTRFFREPHHFEHLRTQVLPPLVASLKKGGRARIWSAGCSNGSEPYSIALTILQLLPEAADYDVKVLATDIDFRMIEHARAGLYDGEQIKPISPSLRDRWMRPVGEGRWEVGPAMRSLIAFRELNLIGDWPMSGRFDAIFCRNVAIYFEEQTQSALWARFVAQLAPPAGRLYIGHSERIAGEAEARLRTDGVTAYALRGAPQ